MPAKIRRIWTLIRQIRGLERCLQELHEYRRRVIDYVYYKSGDDYNSI